ncbi:DUF1302 domain-containing protein [Rhodoferax sp.]|uniref:DUF1302 domain-containing protein n=1 Tax=Rhodoferax sp. TaxID=50421 RepID=UPI0025EAEBBD|nr:DUF1302 domain-containing protein [Rhodoferax sp.]
MQHQTLLKCRTGARLTAVSAAVLGMLVLAAAPAQAMEFNTGNPDLEVRWDNTVRYNLGVRTGQQNKSLVGNNPTYDEGEFRFDNGDLVANRLDLLSELDLVYKGKYGFRVSGAGWYDNAYNDGKAKRNPALPAQIPGSYVGDNYSAYTDRYYAGPSGEILDAFVFGTFDVADAPLSLKAGRHTVFWGESLLLGGAVHSVSYAQSPIDLGKGFATPGAEAKELFRPLNSISGTYQPTTELSLGAQYFLEWESFRYPEGGTFLAPGDPIFNGPQQQWTAFGVVPRTSANEPEDRGEFALAARWSPEALDGTLGFFYRNYTDKLNGVFVTGGGTQTATNPLRLQYGQFYGENIDLFGMSLSKSIGGVSIGTDFSYRKNTPLNSQPLGFTPSGLVGPLSAFTQALFPNGAANVTLNDNSYQARGNTYHLVVNALGIVPKTPLFDTASYVGELTYSKLDKITANQDMYYGEGYGVCNPKLAASPSPQVRGLYKDSGDGCATGRSFGLAFNFTPVWFQVMPGVDLSMPMSYSKTLSGNSPVTLGGNEGNGNYSIGLSADVQSKYRFDLKYVDFFGDVKTGAISPALPGLTGVTGFNGLSTLLKDRGHIMFTFKTTF